MQVRVLGPLEVLVGGVPVPLGGRRPQVILAMLALEANRVVPVDRLVDAVWDEHPPSTARGQVQICVSALRRALGLPDAIGTRPPGYVLAIGDQQLDAHVFEESLAVARMLADADRPAEAADRLRAGLALWRGPALAGVDGRLLRTATTRLEESRLTATEERIRLDLALGRHDELVGELFELVAAEPLRERPHAHLMTALYRTGRPAEALEAFRRARAVFVEELGIEPGEELRRLEHAILSADPALDPPAVARAVVALPGPSAAPRQLPSDIADFLGRSRSIGLAADVLSGAGAPAVPVLAITGPGGVGKSALAVHLAHRAQADFPDGQLYADLRGVCAPVGPAEILARFLRALGVPGPAVPDGLAERAELYRTKVAGRRILIVLDDAASEEQVMPLLPGSASAAVLVTARGRLAGLPGARHLALGVLDRDTALGMLARIVGVERVAAEPRAAAALVELCGGLPLALRIAGARLASRPHWRIGRLLDRLRDETRRLDELEHGSLGIRASISLSYEGLTPPAQRLLRRLALLDAPDVAGWVGAALLDIGVEEAEDLLELLVDAQLLEVVGGARYRFHDLIRVFARERALAEEPVDEVLGRAFGAWLGLAESAHRREYGGDYTVLHGPAPRWSLPAATADDLLADPVAWFDAERAGLVCAVRQSCAHGWADLAWDLAMTSVTLFEAKSYFDDWRECAEGALAACRAVGERRGAAAMLHTLGALHVFQRDFADADTLIGGALRTFEECGDTHGRALVLRNLAYLDRMRSQPEAAGARYADALAGLRAAGDLIGQAHVLSNMAGMRLDAGEPEAARDLLEESLAICRDVGSRRVEAQVRHRLGEVALFLGDLDRAAQDFHWVLRIVRHAGDRIGEAYALYGLGMVRSREGRYEQAEASLSQARLIAEAVDERLVVGRVLHALGELEARQFRHEPAIERLAEARELFRAIPAVIWEARSLLSMGEVYAGAGDLASSERSYDEVVELLSGVDSAEAERVRSRLAGRPAPQSRPAPPGHPAPPRPLLLHPPGDLRARLRR
ncbi:AfsR/SARP family transcriptional regulator [Longispora fulva]|uniref:DNA-binding SARP family transcriptional activator/RecA/RadA recombinase n=1 Tax=Longispora fulva TaxID=619741 RepID=A0A8J7GS78_9ACTN|nr:BTAD domain-containing putative transcriptional regulator [Longispora fulva]MBG6137714.1 DNA-binding SARP family transcriptional activator/RecA/RadA recombinase [Longispora fulva]